MRRLAGLAAACAALVGLLLLAVPAGAQEIVESKCLGSQLKASGAYAAARARPAFERVLPRRTPRATR